MSAAPVHMIWEPRRAQALLHPIRIEILSHLSEPDSATGLARRMGLPRQKLNYHLRQLEADGLVELVEERKKRNCTERVLRAVARSYLITPQTLGALASDPARIRDHASSAYLIAVAAQIIEEVAELREGADREEKRLPTLTMQTAVRFASPAEQQEFTRELSESIAQLVTKYHDEEAPGGREFRLVAGAYPKPKASKLEDSKLEHFKHEEEK